MTLTRLVLAWLPVAVLFAVVGGLETRLLSRPAQSLEPVATAQPERVNVLVSWALGWRSLEAAAVTLFGSLWFDSLGHGEWWLVFGLVGFAVAFAQLPQAVRGSPETPLDRRWPSDTLRRAIRDVARYILAGAILAWRLG